ncbi:hypothetical protein TWF506_003263 [Arthrobotrys conoides]|uniref:Uncharacterized protein n=1 Tax=Arthrobotrys conoides TaxID=74498 RepID=A0AAN8N4P5_9PEZI
MLKGLLGASGKKPKHDCVCDSPKRNAAERKKDRESTPKKHTPNHERNKENPPQDLNINSIPAERKIDILKFPVLPLRWPAPDMNHQQWYDSISLKREDAEFVVARWWQKVQLFFRVYDPYTLKLEEDLGDAVKNVRRLRRERDAWKKEHDDVYVMYQKLKMATDKQRLEGKS